MTILTEKGLIHDNLKLIMAQFNEYEDKKEILRIYTAAVMLGSEATLDMFNVDEFATELTKTFNKLVQIGVIESVGLSEQAVQLILKLVSMLAITHRPDQANLLDDMELDLMGSQGTVH